MNTGMEYTCIVIALLTLGFDLSAVTDLYLTEANVTWNMAELKCKNQNKTLPSIMDVYKYPFESFKFTSVWSSVRESFTPWITNIGCYKKSDEFAWPFLQHPIPNNTVGNCYQLCNSIDSYEGGCKPRDSFFFGLTSTLCVCICNEVPSYFLNDSRNCNIPCLSSIENGYCGGGSNYISVYKKDAAQQSLKISKFYGFCLACIQNSNYIAYSGIGCLEPTKGFCVNKYEVLTSIPSRRTMDDYWAYCTSINLSITGNTEQSFCFRKDFIWTGLRKYRIFNDSTEDKCYSLEQTADSDWVYKRRGCNDNLPFICKPSLIYNSPETTPVSLPPLIVTDFQNTDLGAANGNDIITTPMNSREKEPNSGSAVGYDVFGSSEEYFIINSTVVDWNKAHEVCKSTNGSLVEVKDLTKQNKNNTRLLKKHNSLYWSSVSGSFTPWIAYRGCFASTRGQKNYIIKNQNTVGNCFSRCNWYCNIIYRISLLSFALKGEICYCFCNNPHNSDWELARSNECNITCKNSTEDGNCGGNNHMSFYEVDKGNRAASGFCLAYECHYNKTLGHDCTEEYEGYCVTETLDQHFNFTKQTSLTWNNYSRAFKSRNEFMTAYHLKWPRDPPCNGHAWTGIRKYLISSPAGSYFTSLRSCYTIKWNSKWEYVKSNCDERHAFICKYKDTNQSIERISTEISTLTDEAKITHIAHIPNYGAIPEITVPSSSELFSTPKPTSFAKHFGTDFQKTVDYKSTSTIGIIVGSGLAFFLCVSICLLLLYLKRKRKMRTPSIKFTNKAYEERSNNGDIDDRKKNAIYINDSLKNCSQLTAESDNDDVYVENAEGEYDSLHCSRQKKSSDGDPQYDNTTGWENVYSSTTQQNNTYQDNSYESDYNTMGGTQDMTYSMHDYDTCNRYLTADGNMYSEV